MKRSRTVVLVVVVVAAATLGTAAWAGSGHHTASSANRFAVADAIAASPPSWGTFARPGFGYIAFAPDGTMYTTDCGNARIYKVDSTGPDGHVEVVGGSGPGGFADWAFVPHHGWVRVGSYAGDGQHPTDALLSCPVGLVADAAGDLFIADHLNDRIREITADGFVQTVAGVGPGGRNYGPWTNGVGPEAGDGGPAVHGILSRPWGIAFDSHGDLFIADRQHEAIREIDTRGVLTTVAGTGAGGYNGDNRKATNAELRRPVMVAFDQADNLYISDENNRRIRRVDDNGIITTFAGNGHDGCDGDGGLAVDAEFRNPGDMTFAPDGSLLISDSECHRIRRVAPDGTISTLAHNGQTGCSGFFGKPVRHMPIPGDVNLTYGPDGDLYINDAPCSMIVRVDSNGIAHLFAKAPTLAQIRGGAALGSAAG